MEGWCQMLLFSFTLSVLDMRVMMILLLLCLFLVTLGLHTARAAVLLTATQDVCSQHDPQPNLISPLYLSSQPLQSNLA